MMVGMFGLVWLIMLLVIGMPILLVVLLLGGAAGFLQNHTYMSTTQNKSLVYHPAVNSNQSASPAVRYCSHCGTRLEADWTHCPQCGVTIQ